MKRRYKIGAASFILICFVSHRITMENEVDISEEPFLHIVMFYFDGTQYLERYNGSNLLNIITRQKEMDEVLRHNLELPFVKAVHIITETAAEIKKARQLDAFSKLQAKQIDGGLVYGNLFEYVTANLLHQTVAITNSDISLGEELSMLRNATLLNNTMFSLSRWEPRNGCINGAASGGGREPEEVHDPIDAQCSEMYYGSHDVHILRLTENPKVNEKAMDILNFGHFGTLGSENLFMWWMQTYFGLTVKNPCKTLRTYHCHASGVRSSAQLMKRVNIGGKSLVAKPSEL